MGQTEVEEGRGQAGQCAGRCGPTRGRHLCCGRARSRRGAGDDPALTMLHSSIQTAVPLLIARRVWRHCSALLAVGGLPVPS
jgi:hypothetical protein